MDGIERTEIEDYVFHGSIGLAEKVAHDAFDFRHRLVQYVVDDDVVEFGRFGQFEFRFGDPFGDHLGRVGAAAVEPAFQLLDRRRLDEDGAGVAAEDAFEIDPAQHVDGAAPWRQSFLS